MTEGMRAPAAPGKIRGAGHVTICYGIAAPSERRSTMETITVDRNLVAYCGLYCGACRAYLARRCPGCRQNAKASWCKVRTCCLTNEYANCAACSIHADPMRCPSFNNRISRIFGFVFRSNRAACVQRIREVGADEFAKEMAQRRRSSLPR